MSEFTSGPWEVHPIQKLAIHQPEYECWIPQTEADARLIAAAPDLYSALEKICEFQVCSPFDDEKYEAVMAEAEAALKKARGE